MAIREQQDTRNYRQIEMHKDEILQKLKEKGCRITKQRLLILDIILKQEYSGCKEIYYKASRRDEHIGIATVYRFMNILEEIGAISQKNIYKITYAENFKMENACTVVLDDNTLYNLSAQKWKDVIWAGLKACGYLNQQQIVSVILNECQGAYQLSKES